MTNNEHAMNKLKSKLIELSVIVFIIALVILAEIFTEKFDNKVNSPEIIGIDGIAYIQKGDYTCKLLDEQGRQIAYNDYIWADHEFESEKAGEHYIFKDINTNMVYILIDSEFNNIPSVNIIYNNEWVEEQEEHNFDKNEVTIITH